MERRSILPPDNGQLPSHVDSLDKDDSDISLNEVLLMRIWIDSVFSLLELLFMFLLMILLDDHYHCWDSYLSWMILNIICFMNDY